MQGIFDIIVELDNNIYMTACVCTRDNNLKIYLNFKHVAWRLNF
jgi:hypothetical protein